MTHSHVRRTEQKNLRAGWANVHAYVNGQLVSGQVCMCVRAYVCMCVCVCVRVCV